MGLRGTVQQVAVAAFKAIGDIARPATYKSLTGELTRDLVAGTTTPVSVDYVLKRTIFTKFEEKENDANISVLTDEKFLFPAIDLPVKPKSSDIIVDEDGRIWEIMNVMNDPASALGKLHVRTSR